MKSLDVKFAIQAGIPIMLFVSIAQTMRNITIRFVHEKVEFPAGTKVEKLTGDLEHFTYKSIHHYLVKSAGYAKAWADQRQAKGKKATLWQGITHALGCFVKMYLLKAGFLDGKQGFLLAVLSAHSTFVKYADLWERDQHKH